MLVPRERCQEALFFNTEQYSTPYVSVHLQIDAPMDLVGVVISDSKVGVRSRVSAIRAYIRHAYMGVPKLVEF